MCQRSNEIFQKQWQNTRKIQHHVIRTSFGENFNLGNDETANTRRCQHTTQYKTTLIVDRQTNRQTDQVNKGTRPRILKANDTKDIYVYYNESDPSNLK